MMLLAGMLSGIVSAFLTGSVRVIVIQSAMCDMGSDNLPQITRSVALLHFTGVSSGTLLGGVLATAFSEYAPLLFTAVILSVGQILLCNTRVSVKQIEANYGENALQGVKRSLGFIRQSSDLLKMLVCYLACGTMLSVMESYWQPAFLDIAKGTQAALGPVSFLCSLLALFGSVITGRMLNHHRSWLKLFLAAQLAGASLMIILSLVTSEILFFTISYVGINLVVGMSDVIGLTLLNAETPDQVRSSVSSLMSLSLRSGGLLATVICSLFYTQAGIIGIWRITGVILFAVSVACMWLNSKRQSSQPEVLSAVVS